MRQFAFIAPLAAVAGPRRARPAAQPRSRVTLGGDLTEEVENLGQRDVGSADSPGCRRGANAAWPATALWTAPQVNLVLTDLKPNRPTWQQALDRPGLSIIDSISIGGATIEGQVVTADGRRCRCATRAIRLSLADVYGYSTWQDADRAYQPAGEQSRRRPVGLPLGALRPSLTAGLTAAARRAAGAVQIGGLQRIQTRARRAAGRGDARDQVVQRRVRAGAGPGRTQRAARQPLGARRASAPPRAGAAPAPAPRRRRRPGPSRPRRSRRRSGFLLQIDGVGDGVEQAVRERPGGGIVRTRWRRRPVLAPPPSWA